MTDIENDEVKPLDLSELVVGPVEKHLEKHILGMTIWVGIAEVLFSIFAMFSRLNPTIESKYLVVDIFIDSKIWAGIFLILGVHTLVSMKRVEARVMAMAFSSAGLGIWGLLCVVKSATTVQPVAWSVGVAVAILGFIAYRLCLIWGVLTFNPDKMK